VPRAGWENLSVRKPVKDKIEALGRELGYHSLNDVVVYLLNSYEECRSLKASLAKLASVVRECESKEGG